MRKNDQLIVRVDDRLLHGQVVVGWGAGWPASEIWLACDRVARDEDELLLYKPLIPEHIGGGIVTLEEALSRWNEDSIKGKVLVVVENCEDLHYLLQNKFPASSVHVGASSAGAGKTTFTPSVHLSESEFETIKKIAELGFEIRIHELPNTKPVVIPID